AGTEQHGRKRKEQGDLVYGNDKPWFFPYTKVTLLLQSDVRLLSVSTCGFRQVSGCVRANLVFQSPAFATTQSGNVRDVMGTMPRIQRDDEIDRDRAMLGMDHFACAVRRRQRAEQSDPSIVQRRV